MSQNKDRKRGRPAGAGGPDLKHALLKAAIDLFSERGFDGVSLSQIAAAANADTGLTRYYFGSKAKLWEAAMTYLSDCFSNTLSAENTFTEGTKTDALKSLITTFLFTSAQWPQVSRVIVFDGDKSDARGEFIKTRFVAPFYHLLSDLIDDAKTEGMIADVSTRTIFFMLTHGGSFPMSIPVLTNALPGGDIRSPEGIREHAEAIVRLLLRGDK